MSKVLTLKNLVKDDACEPGIEFFIEHVRATGMTHQLHVKLLREKPEWWNWCSKNGYAGFESLPRGIAKQISPFPHLDLCDCNITKLPSGLTISGMLDLSNTLVEKLPKNLKVGTHLYLDNTKVRRLPKDLQVGKWIIASRGQLDYIPDHLKDQVLYN